jgi:hypothetical protein
LAAEEEGGDEAIFGYGEREREAFWELEIRGEREREMGSVLESAEFISFRFRH